MDTQILIVGAGPTGLALALWLTAQGVKVRIVDRTEGPGTTSRALAVQARTLELYRQLDLAEAVVARGHQTPAVNLWARGELQTRLDFTRLGEGMTPYPFLHIFPQDEHEALLVARLGEMGVAVERRTELIAFEDDGAQISARLRGPDGAEESCEAAFLAGCDGAASLVRRTLGIGFPGGTYRQIFYVADVEASGAAINGELNVDLDEADFLAIFPLADSGSGGGRARLVGTVRGERAAEADSLTFADVSGRAIEHLKLTIEAVNRFSTYHVHHRVAASFGAGRAFLLGDAAHIHSPAGGQGMNTGIGDAVNLAWKLAAVIKGCAPEELLASYEAERIGFARRLVATTDRAFTLATGEGPVADLLRIRVAPLVLKTAVSIEAVREYMFRTVSQITLNYRGGPLSEGSAGKVHGGDRLPWVAPAAGEAAFGNFAPLKAIAWQVHVHGAAEAALRAWCEGRALSLNVFAFTAAHEAAGLTRDAAYLIRPDTYVAAVAQAGADAADSFERFLSERGLHWAAESQAV